MPVIVAPYVVATGQAICEYFSDHALAVTFAVARKLIGHCIVLHVSSVTADSSVPPNSGQTWAYFWAYARPGLL